MADAVITPERAQEILDSYRDLEELADTMAWIVFQIRYPRQRTTKPYFEISFDGPTVSASYYWRSGAEVDEFPLEYLWLSPADIAVAEARATADREARLAENRRVEQSRQEAIERAQLARLQAKYGPAPQA